VLCNLLLCVLASFMKPSSGYIILKEKFSDTSRSNISFHEVEIWAFTVL